MNEVKCPVCGHPVIIACSVPSILEIELKSNSEITSIDSIEFEVDTANSDIDPFQLVCTEDMDHNTTEIEYSEIWDELRPRLVEVFKLHVNKYLEDL